MSTIARARLRPVAVTAARTTALIAVTLVLILVVLPAVLTAASPGWPVGA